MATKKKTTAKKSTSKRFTTTKKSTTKRKSTAKGRGKVEKVMHEYKHGELKSGKGGKGGKVKSRKQAIAIGLSEARQSGAKVPPKKKSSRAK